MLRAISDLPARLQLFESARHVLSGGVKNQPTFRARAIESCRLRLTIIVGKLCRDLVNHGCFKARVGLNWLELQWLTAFHGSAVVNRIEAELLNRQCCLIMAQDSFDKVCR